VSELFKLYQAIIVAHDHAPHHCGPLPGATHDGTVDNPLCGDRCTVHVRISDDRLGEVSFEGQGCALSRAAASIMTDALTGRAVAEARDLAAAFDAFVHAPPEAPVPDALGDLGAFAGVRRARSRIACATLPFRALLAALG
jgi:nitrogen fixation NifU-like protein